MIKHTLQTFGVSVLHGLFLRASLGTSPHTYWSPVTPTFSLVLWLLKALSASGPLHLHRICLGSSLSWLTPILPFQVSACISLQEASFLQEASCPASEASHYLHHLNSLIFLFLLIRTLCTMFHDAYYNFDFNYMFMCQSSWLNKQTPQGEVMTGLFPLAYYLNFWLAAYLTGVPSSPSPCCFSPTLEAKMNSARKGSWT